MKTTYLSIDAQCVTVRSDLGKKVSGGSNICYTRLPRTALPTFSAAPVDNVLDLEACRRRLAEEEAPEDGWDSLSTEESVSVENSARPGRWDGVSRCLDLISTMAVCVCTLGILLSFLLGV